MKREHAEIVGSILWFLMDGFWMLEYHLAARVCFTFVLLIILVYGISALRLRRIRLPR